MKAREALLLEEDHLCAALGESAVVRRVTAPPATEVVLLDEDGVIVWYDDAWAGYCSENGVRLSRVGAGISYLDGPR